MRPGDRRVAWAQTVDGEAVVATEQELVLQGDERLLWWQVSKVVWQRPQLSVWPVSDVESGGPPARQVTLGGDDRGFAEAVRARVTASIAWSSRAQLTTGGSVRIVGRRRPDREVLEWQLVFDTPAHRDDPAGRAEAETLLENARRTVG